MKTTTKRAVALMASASLAAMLIAAASAEEHADEMKVFFHTHYDGVSNDLLTAGLGKTGLGSATAPGFADPLHPTAEEPRRCALSSTPRQAAATARSTGQTSSQTGPSPRARASFPAMNSSPTSKRASR